MTRRLPALVSIALFAAGTANAWPPHEPSVGKPLNGWHARVYDDSQPGHPLVDKYQMCFFGDADEGTHSRYRVHIWGGSCWDYGRGYAAQEGDEVHLYADSRDGRRRIASEWSLIGVGDREDSHFGSGTWTQWGDCPATAVYDFLNVQYEAAGVCRCIDKACEKVELIPD